MSLLEEEIIRGQILSGLAVDVDWTVSDSILMSYLNAMGKPQTQAQLRQHLAYLEGDEKGLIITWDMNSEIRMVKLLPKGKDVLDGREKIKGVQV
jgi:hypothetical protein